MKIRILDSRQAPDSIRNFLSRISRGHAPTVHVTRQQIPYWQERGWTRQGNRYIGNYQTPYGAFQGSAEQRGSTFFRFFIFHPPGQLSHHSHWVCFISRGGASYEVHLARQPSDVSSGIMSIERLITEAFEQA